MAASGARHARLATGAAAVALAGVLAIRIGGGGELDATCAAAGVVLVATAVVRARGPLVAWGLVLLAAAYALSLEDRTGIDGAAPLVATALLLVAELGYWSVELGGTAREEAALAARRLAGLVVLAAGSLGLATLVLAATDLPLSPSAAWNATGIVAAAGILALIARLARPTDSGVQQE